jgi:hypothetical protein
MRIGRHSRAVVIAWILSTLTAISSAALALAGDGGGPIPK